MATWTAPTTRASGALITASIWNTDLVENLKYLKDSPVFDGDVSVGDDLLLTSSGAVINFNGGDVTITHSSNQLAFAGAATAYSFSDGHVLIGTTTARTLTALDSLLQVETAGSTYQQLSLVANRNDTGGASIILGKSRGTTVNSNTVVADGDNLGFIRFQAADGVDMDSIAAQILAQVDGAPGSNDTPGRLIFSTAADGAASVTERMRITSTGVVQPGANDGGALGTGSLAWSDLFLASGGVINFANGDVTITHGTDKISVQGGDLTVGTTSVAGRITVLTEQGQNTVANVIMGYGASTSWPIGFSNVYDANHVDSIFSLNTRPVSGTRGSVLYSGSTAGYVLYINGDGTGALQFMSVPGGSNQSATERARITSGGVLLVGQTTQSATAAGAYVEGVGQAYFGVSSGTPLIVNRNTNDGTLISLKQDGTEEGTIFVSGNTVSYNAFAGSHWSQLADGSKPALLRGTVMESINALCEWPGEDNERLPKCKVSDTAGSTQVYGVFMAWDNDWTATNDLYVTSVGAFICRINAGVTVQQGDLLESNGDGTARVQADGVVRSSTIGKVTSTVKTHEHPDGSYCVPTVLYCG